MALDLDLAALLGTAVVTALVARATRLPITTLEILAGIGLVAVLGFDLPGGADSLLVIGSLLIVFLAGLETNLGFLRKHWRTALRIGIPGFFVPFSGLFAVFYLGLHAPLLIALIGSAALADTSISIVYTTLQQYELAELPIGRLVLASTLAINLLEDSSVTTVTALSTPGILFTLAVFGALGAAALFLPRLTERVERMSPDFSNLTARSLLFSLAVLAALSSMVGVPGILFVFLMGLLFSRFANESFLTDARKLAFAVFVPLYFIAVGLRVDVGFVLQNLPILLVLVAAATALRVGALYPSIRGALGARAAPPLTALMNTRLTSATVILVLSLSLGLVSSTWYSIMVSAVVLLALSSVVALRAMPAFRSAESARRLLGSIPLPADRPSPPGRAARPRPGGIAQPEGPSV